MKRLKLLFLALFLPYIVFAQSIIFSENCGNPTVTTTCVSYTGWQNNNTLTFSASASGPDVRTTLASSGYVGASGGGNIFFVNGIANRFVQISGINTANYTNLSLSFAILKTTNASTGSELVVEVSSNGTTYTALSYSLSTGSGTSNVYTVKTPSGTIPSTSNLRIRFRYTSSSSTCQFRIDDIKLYGCLIPTAPSVSYVSPACDSTIVSLPSNSYLQTTANGTSTSLSNIIRTSGTYYARTVSSDAGCGAVWSQPTVINASIYVKPQILKNPEQVVLVLSLNTTVFFTANSTHSFIWLTSTDGGVTWDTLNITTPFSINSDSLKINVPNETFYNIDGNKFKIISSNGPCQTESDYGVLFFATPLPVELISFDASQLNEIVKLNWTTATETNNDVFEIQRSIDLMNWEIIGSLAGAGFSNSYLSYVFYDVKPINGPSYYRLKQIDFDGKYEFSNPTPVNFKPKTVTPKKYYDLKGIQIYELRENIIYLEFDGLNAKKIMIIK